MGPIASVDDFFDLIRRRAALIALVTFAGCAVSLFAALSVQHQYQAVELIQVDQPNVPDEFAGTPADDSVARRLQLIEQRLMARDNVLDVITRYGLFADLPDVSDIEKVALLRKAVKLRTIAGARQGYQDDGSVSVVSVTAELPSPEQAQAVAHEFAQRIMQLSRDSRMARARTTLDFLVEHEKSLTAEVSALQQEIADFREANELALPGSVEARRAEISALNEALLEIGRERIQIERAAAQVDETRRQATARRLKADYAEQIATLEAQSKLLLDRKTELEQSIATAPEIERQLAEFDRRLGNLQEQLDAVAQRRSEAEIGYRLEAERLSERMLVLEPAVVPEKPVSSGRKKIAILGAGASLAFALALAFLLDLRRPVLRSAAQMERELGFRPVVSVPVMKPRRRFWPFSRKDGSLV